MKLRIMFNVKIRSIWTLGLLLIAMALSAQEICNNGIDDDGDALIDLNDDECGCSVVEPLTYVDGSLCRRLTLELEYPGATSFQWYKDGIAVAGETSSSITLTKWITDVEGCYELLIEYSGGCVISESHCAILESFDTDLGTLFLCSGDTLVLDELIYDGEVVPIVPPRVFTGSARTSFKTSKPSDGCDLKVQVEIEVVVPSNTRLDATLCPGGTFTSPSGNIVVTEPGLYYDTLQNVGGCDSIIRFDLTLGELMPVEITASVCAGETYVFHDISETDSGVYETTVSGDCDTLFRVDLTVEDEIEERINASICSGGLYELGDISTSDPGDHETTFQTADGCDSLVIVTLTIDAAEEYRFQETICQGKIFEQGDISTGEEGEYSYESALGDCDSLIIIELTVTPPDELPIDETICQGKAFEWRGQEYERAGTFTDLESNAGECDILHILNLSFDVAPENVDSQVICEGDAYTWRGNDYKETGRWEELDETPGECDVLEILELTVLENSTDLVESTLCPGESFEILGETFDIPGSYEVTTPNAEGCDSIITVELLAGLVGPIYQNEAICPGDYFTFNGTDYYDEGEHPFILTAANGCDSIITLLLTHSNEIPVTYDAEICEGENYILHDLDVDATGTYTTTVISGTGCDSLVTLNLTVQDKSYYDFEHQICYGDIYTDPSGEDRMEEGSYMVVLENAVGCDSVVTFTLAVLTDEPFSSTVEICEGDTYIIEDGTVAEEAGRYEAILVSEAGCDSTIVIDLQVLPLNQRIEELKICPGDIVPFYGQDLIEEGSYTQRFTNENGCDSVVTYNIELNASVADIILQDTVLVNLGGTEDIEPIYVDESFVSFQWIDNEGNIMTLDRTLTGFYPADDTYVDFVAVNEFGCEIRKRVIIDVELIVEVYAPNVIQPGLDAFNSYFTLGGNESVVGIQEVNIFDRWGDKVFTDTHDGRLNGYIGWDGEYKGKTVLPGVYTWAAVFEIIDGSFVKKAGSVTVIR